MKFICAVTAPKSDAAIIHIEIEALTAGGAIAKINKSLDETFRDCNVLIYVSEVTP